MTIRRRDVIECNDDVIDLQLMKEKCAGIGHFSVRLSSSYPTRKGVSSCMLKEG